MKGRWMNGPSFLQKDLSEWPDYVTFDLKDSLLLHLTPLLNKIPQTADFIPEEWTGFIAPLHNSGNKNIADNYRGITLSSV